MHTPFDLFAVEHGPGWSWITVALMQAAKDKGAQITQIKEKFGGLRFYYAGGDDELEGLVIRGEALAEQTCEMCGAPGKLRVDGWMQTLCDEHGGDRPVGYWNGEINEL